MTHTANPAASGTAAVMTATIVGNAATVEDRVEAFLAWLIPGRNINFGGPVRGSRGNVHRVLADRQGQCHDFSDLFITLCRAEGIPCRQVGGWLRNQTGHVWAEVLVEGKGWVQVDPTAGSRCWTDHIPFSTSESGEMPILYTSMPLIVEVK